MKTSVPYSLAVIAALSLAVLPAHVAHAQAPAPEPGQLHIASKPDGAVVLIAGESRGITPLTLPGMPPGEYLVTIEKQGFVSQRQTILLRSGQRSALDVKLDPLLGLAIIQTAPVGANVRIGGADRGTGPLLLTDLPLGRHRVEVSSPGYLTRTVELALNDRVPQKLSVDLVSNTAALIIDSTPSGAMVTVDGISRGRTPTTVDGIPGGESKLEIALEGYQPYTQRLRLEAGQRETLNAVLTAIPATLSVVSIPPKARIYIDNQFRGVAPIAFDDLPPGAYRVRVELEGYDSDTRTVTLSRASEVTEEFRLQSNAGLVELVTEPDGITVFVDGKEVGATSSDPTATDRVSKSFSFTVTAGEQHILQLTREGYFSKSMPVTIQRNETLTLHEKLKKRFIPDYEVVTKIGTERGVLVEIDANGDVRLETRPGILRTIPAADVVSARPIRKDEMLEQP